MTICGILDRKGPMSGHCCNKKLDLEQRSFVATVSAHIVVWSSIPHLVHDSLRLIGAISTGHVSSHWSSKLICKCRIVRSHEEH